MRSNTSVALNPSGPTSLVSLSICCLMPATRISKNSSRFELKMVRNLTRSMSGWVRSCASSSTRRLNSSQLSSRLMKFCGSEKRFGGGTSFGKTSILAEASSATLVLATAVGIFPYEANSLPYSFSLGQPRRTKPNQPLLGESGNRRLQPSHLGGDCSSLVPDILRSGGINGVFGNVGSMIAHALEVAANKQ